jgi:hypothetical protein
VSSFFRTHLVTSDVHEAELWLSKLANDKSVDVLDVSECKAVDIVVLLEKTVLGDGGKHFEHIETLNLGDCGLGKADGELLATLLAANRTLKKINVANNDLADAFKPLCKAVDANGTLLHCNYAGNDVHKQADVDAMAKALKRNAEKAAKAAPANAKVDPDKPNNPAPLLQAKASAKPAVIARLELSNDPDKHSLVVNDLPASLAPAPAAAPAPTPAPTPAPAAAPTPTPAPKPAAAPAPAPAAAAPQGPAVSAMNMWQLANCVVDTRAQRFQIAQLQIAGIDVLRQFIAGSGPFAALPRVAALAATGTPVPAPMVAEIEAFLQAATMETAGALHVLGGGSPTGTDVRAPQEVMATCFAVAQERANIGQMTDVASQAVSQSLAGCVNAFGGAPMPGMLDGNILVEELRRALTNERAHVAKSDAMVADVQAALRAIQRDLAAASAKARSLSTNQ